MALSRSFERRLHGGTGVLTVGNLSADEHLNAGAPLCHGQRVVTGILSHSLVNMALESISLWSFVEYGKLKMCLIKVVSFSVKRKKLQ